MGSQNAPAGVGWEQTLSRRDVLSFGGLMAGSLTASAMIAGCVPRDRKRDE
jgi:hypothetical protein